MKKHNYLLVLIPFLIGITSSCRHEPIQPFKPMETVTDTTGNNPEGCSPDTAYFNRDVMPIIQLNCSVTGCHGGGSSKGGVDLTSYQSIINTAGVDPFDPANSNLYAVITETDPNKIMPEPPNSPLSNADIAIIEKWIKQGAANNFCADCDETNFTFSGAVFPIIQDNCLGCHSGSAPSAGIPLTTYNEILPFAASGGLYGTINHDPGYVAMPYLGSKLSDCNVNQVKQWIDNGIMND
ncbi:hypothetical protein ERX46_01980 [Brumimicrobium glaciale]|uniref:Cytochrome C Planctomycete-type domain-containing protein n=1 Tax=Brumimicrobium glaciale TaxID=200475 RepID=A0A4Q4KQV6_9FLAO|nr:c-type cytochrome domain-containing protein [Brumimicrobium glaciale]RYM35787.1 hypothetical protein ERX46_01980 [Brumimicrobium glaciale]